MNQSSFEYPPDVDEFRVVGLTPLPGTKVKSPRVAESPVHMECRLIRILQNGQPPTDSTIVLGEIILFHVRDELWAGDQIDIAKWKPIGRLGADFYCRITDIFEMKRPDVPPDFPRSG